MRDEKNAKVIKIPAKPSVRKEIPKRKVAAYARVSTLSDEQDTSFKAQVDYYSNYIRMRGDWTFVGIYHDDGISGRSYRNRDGFNQMVSDALDGKINLIITKSLSRFARNTVDALVTIRKLKAAGVEVYFEKENIYTLDASGEFLITLMSSLAQEESRNISENVSWGHRKRFSDGRYNVAYKRFLGYDRGGNSMLVVNKDEAIIVRLIYRMYLLGETYYAISNFLIKWNIPTPGGKKVWDPSVIRSILHNEKYKGDALLQKRFTVDYLSGKTKKNEGELPQYYVHDGHEAIIPPRLFDMVQAERARKAEYGMRYSCASDLSPLLCCGVCGGLYGRKITHSNDKSRGELWRCVNYYDGSQHAQAVNSKILNAGIVAAFNWLIRRFPEVEATINKLLDRNPAKQRFDFFEHQPDAILLRSVIRKIFVAPQNKLIFTFINGGKYIYKFR